MSADNTLEIDVLAMVAKGTDPAWRASASGYLALFTADPTETGSLAAECADSGYARLLITKSTLGAFRRGREWHPVRWPRPAQGKRPALVVVNVPVVNLIFQPGGCNRLAASRQQNHRAVFRCRLNRLPCHL